MKNLSKADQAAVDAGRVYLAHWLREAHKHGGVVYDIPKVARTGMSRQIVLARVLPAGKKRGEAATPAHIERLFPTLPDSFYKKEEACRSCRSFGSSVDAVARDWGFSFKTRNFVIGGCGMDMVFALVDNLARLAGLEKPEFKNGFANECKRESF